MTVMVNGHRQRYRLMHTKTINLATRVIVLSTMTSSTARSSPIHLVHHHLYHVVAPISIHLRIHLLYSMQSLRT